MLYSDAFTKLSLNFSEFVFDPAKWPREQMDEDFLKLGNMFNAMRSVVRVPSIDPKYNIALLASKQVYQPNKYVIPGLTEAMMKHCFYYKLNCLSLCLSYQDHCLVDILHAWQDNRLPVNITAVIR